jgi:hypothetical protein
MHKSVIHNFCYADKTGYPGGAGTVKHKKNKHIKDSHIRPDLKKACVIN